MSGMTGQGQPDTDGVGPGQMLIDTSEAPQLLISEETASVAISTDSDNDGVIYMGWSEDVDTSSGFPLPSGKSMSMAIDCSEQPVWIYGTADGDSISYIGSR